MIAVESFPRVMVLLATHNGIQWIDEQIKSLLNQNQVDLSILVSDDQSTDGTYEWLLAAAESYTNISVLPRTGTLGSAGKNFYHLINHVKPDDAQYFAYSDQDDIWNADKLHHHIALATASKAVAVSSNVLAFWPNGKEQLLSKSQPQRLYDYLFESAGPGCTFLMGRELVRSLKAVLNDADSQARQVTLHDWLTYAVARSMGYTWVIDTQPSMLYRQHGSNVVGANVSLSAKLSRLKKMRDGWYRQQVILITRIAYAHSKNEALGRLLRLLGQAGWGSRIQLLSYAWQGRRSFHERIYLMIAILMNWF
jgi:rhamnosyltransferase